MRIALVSYEYPPDTAVGGIATYTRQWAKLLSSRGHDVEVFCASTSRAVSEEVDGVVVHRVPETDRIRFKETILPVFTVRHQWKKFDVVESPEFNADGKLIKETYPEIKLVVKLHTPSFLMDELNEANAPVSFLQKLRVITGAYRRFQKPSKYWKKNEAVYKDERIFTAAADYITSPSLSLRTIVARKWKLPLSKIAHLPNPYIPDSGYLSILPSSASTAITYLGRLEKRKGILIFREVIPAVLEKHPEAKFRFIGSDSFIQPLGCTGKQILQKKLAEYNDRLEFIEHVPLEKIPGYLAESVLCVYPSLWENFPTVCLEAMSAARAVVGSKNGGMEDMLADPKAGILTDPANASEIAAAICYLLENPEIRYGLGAQARRNVLEKYNAAALGAVFEKMINNV
ncbi:glycosyltransferase family 1 protein [Lacibacter luteus]|uniref:Glycosyltransferase family 1 protein n=1 Tax=Lacibacter luteus TaxID=2508719 RepID=A0A4Q1CD93_9BACT|nr:glycosyltransferase family 4 protein [Lacibacter luteus]RXK57428.1 glycosyltransferase family 1 protein [Lacibacter luteus]